MDSKWTVVGLILCFIFMGVLLVWSYQSCRVKFPNAPAWACLVR